MSLTFEQMDRLENVALNCEASRHEGEVERIKQMTLDTKINYLSELYKVDKSDVKDLIYFKNLQYQKREDNYAGKVVKIVERWLKIHYDLK